MKKRILFVDDDAVLAQEVKLALEETDHFDVFIETSGRKAFDKAVEVRPDLILLDLHIPDLPGGEIASQLSANQATKKIPIVYFTALVTPDEIHDNGGLIGGQPFLAKPCRAQDIVNTIEDCLSRLKRAA